MYSSESAVRNPPSIPVSAAAVCDRSTLTVATVAGNVRIIVIKYQYLNCINISDVLCFFPETHPQNLDIRQHAKNTNIITPPSSTSSSGPHHERVAGPRCTAVAVISCSIGGCDPSSVITASLFCCAVRVCAVCRPCAAKIWSNCHDARFWIRWREFEPRRVHVYLFVFQLFFCLLYTSPSPRDKRQSRMPSSA